MSATSRRPVTTITWASSMRESSRAIAATAPGAGRRRPRRGQSAGARRGTRRRGTGRGTARARRPRHPRRDSQNRHGSASRVGRSRPARRRSAPWRRAATRARRRAPAPHRPHPSSSSPMPRAGRGSSASRESAVGSAASNARSSAAGSAPGKAPEQLGGVGAQLELAIVVPIVVLRRAQRFAAARSASACASSTSARRRASRFTGATPAVDAKRNDANESTPASANAARSSVNARWYCSSADGPVLAGRLEQLSLRLHDQAVTTFDPCLLDRQDSPCGLGDRDAGGAARRSMTARSIARPPIRLGVRARRTPRRAHEREGRAPLASGCRRSRRGS